MKLITSPDPATVAATFIEARLREALDARGRAVLLLSGGSSPRPVHEQLSRADLDWAQVTVGLVDERVDPAGSNAEFIRDSLLLDRASAATFVPMKTDHPGEAYAPLVPADVCVMGMGTDGHTASWFPGSPDLSRAMDPDGEPVVVSVDGTGCPGAGQFAHRLSLTLPAVMASRSIVLFIPGQHKREVFEAREGLPVDALTASPRLLVVTEGS